MIKSSSERDDDFCPEGTLNVTTMNSGVVRITITDCYKHALATIRFSSEDVTTSPNTRAAILKLAEAIDKDNNNIPQW